MLDVSDVAVNTKGGVLMIVNRAYKNYYHKKK